MEPFFSQPIPENIQVNAARGRIKEPAKPAVRTTEPVFQRGFFYAPNAFFRPFHSRHRFLEVCTKFDGYADDNNYEALPCRCRCASHGGPSISNSQGETKHSCDQSNWDAVLLESGVKTNRWKRSTALALLLAMLGQGCAGPGSRLQYLIGEDGGLKHYENYATSIEYPTQTQPHEINPELLRGPRSITSLEEVEPREMTLNECIRMAMTNADIIVDDQSFGSPSNPLLGNPSRVASVWDNAIQDTGFLFGNLGPEAALSNFDPILTNSFQGGVSEDPQNSPNIGIPAGGTLQDHTAQFQTRLEKTIATAGTLAVQHDVNYSRSNQARLFDSAYSGGVQAEYRQPLLAGSGVEFTRIAGPQQSNVRGVSGVAQGVLISRINSDISLLEFEQSVTTLLRDVENRYWDLYLYLQLYESEIETFQDLLRFHNDLDQRDEFPDAVAQAENRIYEGKARIQGSLGDVLQSEYRLRRLLGLPLNDGTFITPVDVPSAAKLELDWESSLLESLSNRHELRRQKWEIRSLELQYKASQNLARPRLDLVSQYRVNGLGDNLRGREDDDGTTDVGYNSYYESLSQGLNTTWTAGVSFSMPLGLRLARAQIRNYELRLRKAHAILAKQEEEIGYELSDAMIKMEQNYLLAETGLNKAAAAKRYAESALTRTDVDDKRDAVMLGRVLEAKITSRDADQGYLKLIVDYNKAITEVNFRKGAILHTNSIFLSEGEWNTEAYDDARIRGEAMSQALDNMHLRTVPEEFVGGPDVNSWESQGSSARPFEPGAVENLNPTSPATFEMQPGTIIYDVPATERQETTEPLPQAPNAAEEPPMPFDPAEPRDDDFLDPVHYQSQPTPESKTSSHPVSSRSIREFRSKQRHPVGRAALETTGPDNRAMKPQTVTEPLRQTPNAAEKRTKSFEPAKPRMVDDFLDPVNYQSQPTPESETSSRPVTSKSIRELRSMKRHPVGHGGLN